MPDMLHLPPCETPAAYDALPTHHPAYLDVAAELGYAGGWLATDAAPSRLPGGSLPVIGLGPRAVVKLFPPCYADEARREADVLGALGGVLSVPTPTLLAVGVCDGWRYVVMSRLPGALWSTVDDRLSARDRLALARVLGQATAELHQRPATFDWPGRDWPPFIRAQRAGAAARQARMGLDPGLVKQIEPFLAQHLDPFVGQEPIALLHTEIMREHLFIEQASRGWRASGLFDFEPARLGRPEYDLASVGLFVAAGDASIFHAFLDGYGLPSSARNPALQRRCLGWALVHEYSNLPWYLRRLPPTGGADTLDALARRWWPL